MAMDDTGRKQAWHDRHDLEYAEDMAAQEPPEPDYTDDWWDWPTEEWQPSQTAIDVVMDVLREGHWIP